MYAFTETWLNSNTLSKQIFSSDFTVYRTDRSRATSPKASGGGVLLAVRSTFNSRLLHPPNSSGVEQVWVAVTLPLKVVFICVLYLPPDRLGDSELIDQHIDSLFWVVSKMNATDEILVVGDFNLASVNWSSNETGFFHPRSNGSYITPLVASLLDCYNTADLLQRNGISNENHRLLDLCFLSRELASNCSVQEAPEPLVKRCRHHSPLQLSLHLYQACTFRVTVDSVSYDYRRTDFEGMATFFENISWDDELRDRDANAASSIFSNIVVYAIDQFVPMTTPPISSNPPWTNHRLKRLKSSKRAALKTFCKLRTDASKRKYNLVNKQYKRLNKQLYQAHQRHLQTKL